MTTQSIPKEDGWLFHGVKYTGIFPVVVRMAFTTTQTIDNILLRGINFRTSGNAAISTQYILYANGQGQTYWSNSVTPQNLSTLSTSMMYSISTLSSYINSTNANISSLQSTIQFQSTLIDGGRTALLSTSSQLQSNDASLSNSIIVVGNQFIILSNSLGIRVDAVYTSTLRYVQSTLAAISSISTFTGQISSVEQLASAGLSTLSTTIGVQNTSTYNTLTINYTNFVTSTIVSTTRYTNSQISTLSTPIGRNNSTIISLSRSVSTLTSSVIGNTNNVSTLTQNTTTQITAIYNQLYFSSILSNQSSIGGLESRVDALENLSTNLSSITNSWISTALSTNTAAQSAFVLQSINSLNSSISTLVVSTNYLYNSVSSLSTILSANLSSINSTQTSYNSTLKGLQYEFSVITTSSILSGIYDTFIQLEFYTSSLIGSTIATVDIFKSTTYYSTTQQNMSISQGYFNFYVSTLYASTLSTLIPSTIAFTSTLVSTLYSTSFFVYLSTVNSTSLGLTNQFNSTTSSLTYNIIRSTQDVLNSSIFSYLSTPSAVLLSTISTIGYDYLSTFSSLGRISLIQQSTIFASTQTVNQINFNVIYNSTTQLYSTYSTFFSQTATSASQLLSSFSTQSSRQLSTQNSLFISTLLTYGPIMTSTITSTNNEIYRITTSSANSTLNSIQNSTITTYNLFVSSLINAISTAGFSTLYTSQTITLNNTNFEGTMDLAGYTNFNININNIVDAQSTYRVKYAPLSLTTLDYRKGLITINISTVGQAYTNYGSKLRFDVYRWGIPTTVWAGVYPYISNADYTLQYEYNILNNIVYTNLLNVYPRLATYAPSLSTVTGRNVWIASLAGYSSNHYWRGTPLQITWSNYCKFPYALLGAPNFDPEIIVDVYTGTTLRDTYGPYPITQSTATIYAPYIRNASEPLVGTTVKTYVVGKSQESADVSFFTVIPTFDTLTLNPRNPGAATQFIGGAELVGIADTSNYVLYNAPISTFTSGFSPSTFYNGDSNYKETNLVNGLLNYTGFIGQTPSTLRVGASNILGQFSENSAAVNYADFYVNLGQNYFTNLINMRSLGSEINVVFSNATKSYNFTATNIDNLGGNLFRVYNPSVVKATNTFITGGEVVFIRYSCTPVDSVFDVGGYTEYNYVGPYNTGTPDPAVFTRLGNLGSMAAMRPFSTIVYYNFTPTAPVDASNANSNTIDAQFIYLGEAYRSTLILSTTSAQLFRF